jgi:hypothetical protein
MPNEVHNPAKIAIGGIVKAMSHLFLSESGGIEGKFQINALHKGAKFSDGFGVGAIPWKWLHIAGSPNSAAELWIGAQNRFGFSFLSNKNHGNRRLIDDIFEEIGDRIEHMLRVMVENVLEFIDEDHAHLTTFEQRVAECVGV